MIDKKNEIVLIHAYLSDKERKAVCHKFIKQFKSFGYDVIITTHLPLDKDTQKLVDYAIYDKDNVLLDDPVYKGYLIQYCFADDGKGGLKPVFNIASKEFFKNNTIMAVLRLLLAGVAYAKVLNKKVIHLFDYDGFLPFDDELIENSDLILNQGKQAVVYEREKEALDIDDGWGGRKKRHWQIMTLIMSCNVDFLYRRLNMYSDHHLKKMIIDQGMGMGEELLGYVLGVSYLNKREDSFEENIEIKNLEEASKKIGFEKQQIYTDVDHPWICIAWDRDHENYRFFAMPPKGKIECAIFRNGVHHNTFEIADWVYVTDSFSEEGLENITIHVNGKFFREYDFTKPETRANILMNNSWTNAPQQ
jgi:hypothetical protein